MPYNTLILPLCGGYFVLLNFVIFKYKYQRLSSQRLLFTSIIAAVFILFLTFLLRFLINLIFPNLENIIFAYLNGAISIKHIPYLWTSLASFLLAICGTWILNGLLYVFNGRSHKWAVNFAVKKYGDEIENLFRLSATQARLMKITLKNDKVYIGFTDIIPAPRETNYLTITPLLSGYRDSESKTMKLVTDYSGVLGNYIGKDPDFESFDIDIAIKQDEILTAGFFDPVVFDKLRKQDDTNK